MRSNKLKTILTYFKRLNCKILFITRIFNALYNKADFSWYDLIVTTFT